jgi:hypothetical protein
MGGFILLRPGQQAAEAVHLIFVGEKSRSTHPLAYPPIRPESKEVLGIAIPVAALSDLVQMKLNSFRAKDLVHLEILDASGLIIRGRKGVAACAARTLESRPPAVHRRGAGRRVAFDRVRTDRPGLLK